MAGLLLRTIWLLYLRDNPAVELMILVVGIIYIYYIYYIYIYITCYKYIFYIYIYIYLVSIYICIFVYFYIGQSFKEINFAAGIKNCLTLVVKVKNLKSITSMFYLIGLPHALE